MLLKTFRFKRMMGVGNQLCEPQLTEGQELNGDVISRIFPQKTVYLQPIIQANDVPRGVIVISDN